MTQDRITLENLNWFYAQDGQAIGPLSFSELQGMVKAGQLAPETQIVEEGGHDWRPIRDALAVSPPMPPTAKPKPEISTARKAAGWGCLSLLMMLGAVAMLSPATKDEPGAIVENAPAAKETPPPQAPIAATKPQPASATLSEVQKEAYRKELLSIYHQIEAFRPTLAKRKDLNDMDGASKAGQETKDLLHSAIARAKQIKQEAENDLFYTKRAAHFIEELWWKYWHSGGKETDSTRLCKEAISESLKAPEILNAK